jgi:pyruvate/2-oxoacid:ferredoxin oxidoreductase beta subunit
MAGFALRSVRHGLALAVVLTVTVAGVANAATLKVTTTKDSGTRRAPPKSAPCVTSSETITFSGVTITSGHADRMPGGGGILVDFVSSNVSLNLALVNSAVSGNTATVSTGAMPAAQAAAASTATAGQ